MISDASLSTGVSVRSMLLRYAAQPFTIVSAALEFTLGISTVYLGNRNWRV